MKSPFKFLDAYTEEDRDVFFGRSEEVAALYDMVTQNRLILVYGQSGTGKTSLIQCGLAAHFDATDWLPVFIRRQDDLNRVLEQSLGRIAGRPEPASVTGLAEEIYLLYLRPLYLIFDQLEELFILGSREEQLRFIGTIRSILDLSTPCRILFVIREEYLAHLYEFERTVPSLFDRRLRVEPVGATRARDILRGSFRAFNIRAETPEDETFSRIVDNISSGRAGIQLPYLQVYLDMLYRSSYERTYSGAEPPAGGQLPVDITHKEITALGKMENVLERFLREQQDLVQAGLQQEHPGTDKEAVKKVLDVFVSEEGTKRPVGYTWQDDLIQPEPRLRPLFEPFDAAVVTYVCRAMERARLLRFGEGHMELAHDALAALIDNQRTAEQRRLRDAYNRVQSACRDFRETGEYLSRRQLNAVEDLLPQLESRLSSEAKSFLRESYAQAETLEQAELSAERRKRRQARRIAIAVSALAVVALAAFVQALYQYRAAARNAAAARRNIALMLKVEGKYDDALAQLSETERFAYVLPAAEQNELGQLRDQWRQIKGFVAAGDSLAALDDLRNAAAQYQAAQNVAADTHLDNLVTQTQKDLESKFAEYLLHGQALMNTQKYPEAADRFEKALLLKPGETNAQRLLQECRRRQETAN